MKADNQLKALFVSRTRFRLLSVFFNSPQDIFFVRELVRLTGEEINSVRRELARLSGLDLLLSEPRGHRLFYHLNLRHQLIPSLAPLMFQTRDFVVDLVSRGQKSQIELLLASFSFLTRSTTKSDNIDFLLIGGLSLREIEKAVGSLEKDYQREINYMVMNHDEFHIRLSRRDPLLVEFFLSC